jgi:hypothetical protein
MQGSSQHYLIGAPEACSDTPPGSKPRVNTFDVFDTLIARRCIDPATVFDLVEQRVAIAGFATARRQAEARIAAREYTIDTIYAELGRALDLDAAKLDEAKAAEIAIELEQVIPIAENLDLVQHGDILISDMYLGAANIRRLLDAAGLDKKVSLLVSSGGKRSGAVWPLISARFHIAEHLGDHPISDNAVPRSLGIQTRQVDSYRASVVENALLGCGLGELAQLCRHARLATWSPDADARGLQVTQANLNFPLMVLASTMLVRTMQRLGKRHALFSSRDCDAWMPLFARVATAMAYDCSTTYYYTSRLAKMRPSEDYLAYSRDLIGSDSVVVDLCGTGWSIAHLAANLGLNGLPVFFLHKLPPAKVYEATAPSPATCQFHAVMPPDTQGVANTELEMCNYADHPMVADVRMFQGVPLPIFADEPRSPATLALVRTQQACFHTATTLLDQYDLSSVYALDDASIVALSTALYQALSHQGDLQRIYGASHMHEDVDVRRRMGCPW